MGEVVVGDSTATEAPGSKIVAQCTQMRGIHVNGSFMATYIQHVIEEKWQIH